MSCLLQRLRVLALVGLAWGMLAAAEARPRLVVGIGIGYAPYEYLDSHGQPAGFVADLIRAVAQEQGVDLVLRPMPFHQQHAALLRGDVDALAGMALTPARETLFDTCLSHSLVSYGIVVRAGDRRIRSRKDLQGKMILGLQGGVGAEAFRPEWVTTLGLPTHEIALQALQSGSGDCALVPKHTLFSYLRSGSVKNLRMVPLEFFGLRRGFAVRKGDTATQELLNQGLFRVQASGQLTRIHEQHLGPLELKELSLTQGLRRVKHYIVGGIFFLGALAATAWILVLRRTVCRRTAALQSEVVQRQEAEDQKAALLEERDAQNAILQNTVKELCRALSEVEQLTGLIPICAECKSVRDDQGYWTAVEAYVGSHTSATFSHGLCPCCANRHRDSLNITRA